MANGILSLTPKPAEPDAWDNLAVLNKDFDTPIWNETSFTRMLLHADKSCEHHRLFQVDYAGETAGLYGFTTFAENGITELETLIFLRPCARRQGLARRLLQASAGAAQLTKVIVYSDVRTTNNLSTDLHFGVFPGLEHTIHQSPSGYQTWRWLLNDASIQSEDTELIALLAGALTELHKECSPTR